MESERVWETRFVRSTFHLDPIGGTVAASVVMMGRSGCVQAYL